MRSGLLALVLVILVGCDGDRTSSPTSRFVAVRSHVSSSVVTFRVEDGYGHVLYTPPDRFTEPVTLAWDADERLWIRTPGGIVLWAPRNVGGDWAAVSPAGLTPPTEIGPRGE